MPAKLSEFLLLRLPLNSKSSYQIEDLGKILSDRLFLSAIYLASPEFFSNLEKKNFDPEKLSERDELTIRKYYNRSCFRPTPFGLFSSVSLIGWNEEPLIVSAKAGTRNLDLGYDRKFTNQLGLDLNGGKLAADAVFEANPFLYRLGKEYRFLRSAPDPDFEKREYQLQSIGYSLLLNKLFQFCNTGRSRKQIIAYMIRLAGCSAQEAAVYVDFLADAQLLLNTLRPNVSGEPYLERLKHFADRHRIPDSGIEKLLRPSPFDLEQVTPGKLKRIALQAERSGPRQQPGQTVKLAAVFARKVAGGLSSSWKTTLQAGLRALDKLCPEPANPAMEEFARVFHQRFEHQAVPLLEALDPEIGIGYFLEPQPESPLLETLQIQPEGSSETRLQWTPAHSLLLNRWERPGTDQPGQIQLQPSDLEQLPAAGTDKPVLGTSILFRIAGRQLMIESAGGVNPLALFGRFAPGHEAIASAMKKTAEDLEAANPQIIFAELLHLLNPKAENVALRENSWSWDIPLTAVSTQPPERQLRLDYLFVTVEQGIVCLWSREHQKMVIPRLTSAYNHQLNQLPLFRFLADLPYQYGRSALTLNLSQFFPGLRCYPRVSFQDCILHPASWILDESEIRSLQTETPQAVLDNFRQLDKSRQLPGVFTLTEGDQQLTFHKKNEKELLFFAGCLKNKKEAVVREFPEAARDEEPVRNAEGGAYISQFSAAVLPAAPLDLPVAVPLRFGVSATQRKFIPGSEWLYLKIYSSPSATVQLLAKIYPLLKKQYRHGRILKWFFIRYEDHAPHIRLRLHIHPADTGMILADLKFRLEDKINLQVVREYQVDVYSREIERYEGVSYELTEEFFWASSELVYRWLIHKKNTVTDTGYLLAIRGLQDILNSLMPDRSEQVQFTLGIFEQFLSAFNQAGTRRELDRKYRELREQLRTTLTGDFYQSHLVRKPASKFKLVLREIDRERRRNLLPGYLSAIIHMHLNRIFARDSRKQEMVAYYLYHKFLVSETARDRQKIRTPGWS